MKFGIGIHNCREGKDYPQGFTTPDNIIDLAQFAEQSGFDSIWADDHVAPDETLRTRDAKPPQFFEPFISVSQLAAVTSRIRIGLGVLVLIWRDPVLAAKQVATLDVISKGRMLLGVGLGGSRFEFEAVNPRWKKGHRGNILSEQIEVVRLLLSQDAATYRGKYYEIDGLSFYPKPAQDPLPIYFTGTSSQTMLRVARWGNGLFLKPDPAEIVKAMEALKPVLEDHQRDPSEIDVALSATLTMGRTHQEAVDRLDRSRASYRRDHVVGTPAEIVEEIGKLREAGIRHFTAQRFGASTYGELKEQVQMLAEEVLPAFKPHSKERAAT